MAAVSVATSVCASSKVTTAVCSSNETSTLTTPGTCHRTDAAARFAPVTAQLHSWFKAAPWRTSRELLELLQAEHPGTYPDRLLRTLQRRLKIWRSEIAHAMVFGGMQSEHAESQLAAAVRS